MNFRLTAVLLAGVVVLAAVLLVTSLTDEDTGRADGGLVPALALAGVKEKDVDTVELVRTQPTEQRLVFTKDAAGKWALKEPHAGRVDGFQIDRIVSDLYAAKPVPHPDLTTNLTSHGLSPATVRVVLKAGDKTATVNVGDTSRGADKAVTFATTSDRPDRPVAVRRADLAGLFRDGTKAEPGEPWKFVKTLADLRGRRPLGGDSRDPAADLAGVKISAGGKDVALTHKPGGPWLFASPAGFGEADTNGASEPTPDRFTGVRPLLTALTGLHADGPDDFIEAPGDLAQYGLNPGNPDLVRVELTPAAGPPEVLLLGKRVEADGKPVVPAKVFARVEGDPAVVRLTTDRLDAIRTVATRAGELRNRDVLPETLRDRADAIDLTAGGTTTKLRKVTVGAGKRWVLYGGPNDPQEANQQAVADLLAALTKPRAATDVLTAPYDAAFAAPEQKATVKVWVNGVPAAKAEGDKLPAEPAPAGTPTELVFGLKDKDGVLVRRTAEGGKTDLKVSDDLLAAVTKGRPSFLDVKLTPFAPADVTKLTLQRGADKLELSKAGDKWTFDAPPAQKGKSADAERADGLVGVLAGVIPVKVLSEQPTPDELKRWGLDPAAPRVKATVGLKAGEVVLEFGNETDDKLYVTARQGGKPLVFTVAKVLADRLLADDLRDRTLFHLDPALAVGLKVRGWKGPAGVQTVELEKKGADWVAKSPPTAAGFTPDPVKVTALLAALKSPKVTEYAGLGKPAYGLDVDQNPDALEFTVLFPAPTPAVTLVLGGKAPAGGVYAASSAVPGEAVTLDPTPLRAFVEKPTSLGK